MKGEGQRLKILIELAYDGSAYHGFQVQGNQPTVQKAVGDALFSLFGQRLSVSGCSRTDSGVHARQFFCTAEGAIPEGFPAERLPFAVRRYLPEDIVVLSARQVPDSFHVRYDVLYKEYEYLILNRSISDPFLVKRAYLFPYPVDEGIMNEAAACFVGTHDFSAFRASGSGTEGSVRTIKYFSAQRRGDTVAIKVAADGFLYNMVRILCGTLLDVNSGVIRMDDIPGVIASCDRSRAGATLPAHGLYLNRVVYRQPVF